MNKVRRELNLIMDTYWNLLLCALLFFGLFLIVLGVNGFFPLENTDRMDRVLLGLPVVVFGVILAAGGLIGFYERWKTPLGISRYQSNQELQRAKVYLKKAINIGAVCFFLGLIITPSLIVSTVLAVNDLQWAFILGSFICGFITLAGMISVIVGIVFHRRCKSIEQQMQKAT